MGAAFTFLIKDFDMDNQLTLEDKVNRVLDNQEMILGLMKNAGLNMSEQSEEDQKYVFTPKEAVEYLKKQMPMSMTSFRRRIKEGVILPSKNNSRMYLRPDLDKFIKNPS